MNRRLAASHPLLLKLFRHTIPKGRELTLERRRIYALPTRYGLLYAFLLQVMLLGSINYNNSLGFMLSFLLASMGIVSILYTYRNIAHLQLRGGKATPTFAGKSAHFTVYLRNTAPLLRCALRLTALDGATALADIAAMDDSCVELVVKTTKRGRLPLGRITLSTIYPLGLVRAWAYVDLDMSCVVYPQPGTPNPLTTEPHHPQGIHASRSEGSDDFLGFRPYHPGDALRHIHWKSLARALPLQSKKFTASETPDLWLDWAALTQLDNEARLRVLCRLVLDAEHGGQRYGLRLPGTEIPPAQGASHLHRCLEALALFGEARP